MFLGHNMVFVNVTDRVVKDQTIKIDIANLNTLLRNLLS